MKRPTKYDLEKQRIDKEQTCQDSQSGVAQSRRPPKMLTVKLKTLDEKYLNHSINGRPVSPSIMAGDSYKLRRDREDLYNRVLKTVNMSYAPK